MATIGPGVGLKSFPDKAFDRLSVLGTRKLTGIIVVI